MGAVWVFPIFLSVARFSRVFIASPPAGNVPRRITQSVGVETRSEASSDVGRAGDLRTGGGVGIRLPARVPPGNRFPTGVDASDQVKEHRADRGVYRIRRARCSDVRVVACLVIGPGRAASPTATRNAVGAGRVAPPDTRPRSLRYWTNGA